MIPHLLEREIEYCQLIKKKKEKFVYDTFLFLQGFYTPEAWETGRLTHPKFEMRHYNNLDNTPSCPILEITYNPKVTIHLQKWTQQGKDIH